ncbi:MAG: glycosyltransferase [Bacteroidales bacterium]|jgi:glycosyltransferase involved in cell wall biosynthesis|nr:glycosyltransferase [Bacteroidales bacterium]
MISVLIPVYNWDVAVLVHSLREAITGIPEYGELIIGDDGSSPEFRSRYENLAGGPVRIITAEKNIGRAAIRNKLALEARGEHLLFIDADAMIPGTAESYLNAWLPFLSGAQVICGGTQYPDYPPGDPEKALRWRYGRSREQIRASERNKHPHARFSGFNFIVSRELFMKIRFNEELKQYGHEDTLLGFQLLKAGIIILHIDNALIHEGIELNSDFIVKTKQGIENLSILYDKVTDKKAFASSVRLVRTWDRLSRLGLTGLLAAIYIRFRERMEMRLLSSKSSLALFGFFKICLFATYRAIHQRRNIIPIF